MIYMEDTNMDKLREELSDFLEWNGISQTFVAETLMAISRKRLGKFLKGNIKKLTDEEVNDIRKLFNGDYFMTMNQIRADPDYQWQKKAEAMKQQVTD